MADPGVAAIVLAGGEGRRFGGDKLAAPYAGTTVLDALLSALPEAWLVVCVGPERPTVRAVTWTREEPAGGGPAAGIAAGLSCIPPEAGIVAVLAGDQPRAANAARRLALRLTHAPPTTDAVVAVDDSGRANPLLSAFRRAALADALPSRPAGRAARTLLDGLQVESVDVPPAEQHDIDHPGDL